MTFDTQFSIMYADTSRLVFIALCQVLRLTRTDVLQFQDIYITVKNTNCHNRNREL